VTSRPPQSLGRRPSPIDSRRRAFLLTAAAVLIGLAVLITVGGDDAEPPATGDSATLPPPPPPPPSPGGSTTTEVPGAAEIAAEEFADGYVRFTYGLVTADELESAAPELVADLERQAPRVSDIQAEAAKGAEVTNVELSLISASAVEAVVTIRARDLDYAVAFDLSNNRGRWLVTDVSTVS